MESSKMEGLLDTPAKLKGEARVDAVIVKHAGNAAEADKKAYQLGDEVVKAAGELNVAASKIGEVVKANERDRGRWSGLGLLFGKEKRQEKAASAVDKVSEAGLKVQETGKAEVKALSTAIHEIEVAKANIRGGPLEAGSKLTESLSHQNLTSKSKGE